jgi:hypothetical protein
MELMNLWLDEGNRSSTRWNGESDERRNERDVTRGTRWDNGCR